MTGGRDEALRLAVDLVHVPSLGRNLRASPLPDGIDLVLRIAAGDEEAEDEAIRLINRDVRTIREAAVFFIQQVMLNPDADHYRVLGAAPDAAREDLRHNFSLLMRWLHPDRDEGGRQSVFFGRVVAAWDTLKSEKSRAAYDRTQAQTHPRPNGDARPDISQAVARKQKTPARGRAGVQRRPRPRMPVGDYLYMALSRLFRGRAR